jgi:hypothetical protein
VSKEILHVNLEVDEVKRQCATLRAGCQTETCSRIERLGEILESSIKELKKDIRDELKTGSEEFKKIILHMGEVKEYMRTHNNIGGKKEAHNG